MADNSTPALLNELLAAETEEYNSQEGLDAFKGLRISAPTDFVLLEPKLFKRFKEEVPLATDLPRAPTLGQASFLIKGGSKDIKDQFEDSWATTGLVHACAAQVLKEVQEAVKDQQLPEDHDLVYSSRRLVLAAANAPARALATYKWLATKSAVASAPKPGTQKADILSADELKSINTALDTTQKLQRKTGSAFSAFLQPRRGRGNRYRGRRGRGRYRRRGRRYPTNDTKHKQA